jgi:hypothetical protein
MVTEGVQRALQALKAERDRIDSAIASLESLVAGGDAKPARKPGRRPGRKPGRRKTAKKTAKKTTRRTAKKTAKKAVRGKRKNAPRGLLQEKMHEVLKKAGKPLGATALRDALIAAGYPAKDPNALYTALYAAAKKHPKVKKTAAGFSAK